MIRRPPRSTLSSSSAASDVYKRQGERGGQKLCRKGPGSCLGTAIAGRHVQAQASRVGLPNVQNTCTLPADGHNKVRGMLGKARCTGSGGGRRVAPRPAHRNVRCNTRSTGCTPRRVGGEGEATTFVAGAYDSVGSCGRGRCGWRVRHAIVATTSVRRRRFLCIQIGMYSDMCVLS